MQKIFFVLIAFFLSINFVLAYPNGVSGYTKKHGNAGCGNCHGALNSNINVVISGPSTLKPNQTGLYKVTISGGTGTKVGVDIAVSNGVLSTYDANLKILNGELTQPSPKAYVNGKYEFNFYYKAPAEIGNYIIYATGESKKPEWNFANNFNVNVSNPTIFAPTNLVATFDNSNVPKVFLTWSDNSDNESYFVVERSIGDANNFLQIAELQANITSYVDSVGLVSNVNNYYRVYAKNSETTSAYSNIAQVFCVLPVQLTSFTANLVNNSILLQWITSSEINNYGFKIYKQVGDEWNFIGFVKGAGNSLDINKYYFEDKIIDFNNSKIKYLLKQVDFNGAFSVYGPIEVNLNNIPLTFKLNQNYPNPFNPITNITFILPEALYTTLTVYDITGKEICKLYDGIAEKGINKVTFDGNFLSSGIYICRLKAGNYSNEIKMSLIK